MHGRSPVLHRPIPTLMRVHLDHSPGRTVTDIAAKGVSRPVVSEVGALRLYEPGAAHPLQPGLAKSRVRAGKPALAVDDRSTPWQARRP